MQNKSWMWTVLIVIVLLVLGVAVWKQRAKQQTPSPASTQTQTPAATATPSPTPTTTGGSASGMAYSKALQTYKYRIQFIQCHGTVNTTGLGTLLLKKGDQFMMDNRDSVSHLFAFKGHAGFRIGGYGYAVVTATTYGTYPITCDGGGAATLTVE